MDQYNPLENAIVIAVSNLIIGFVAWGFAHSDELAILRASLTLSIGG